MDYVIYGTGYGATLMLLGYAIRTWGPGWRFRDGDESAYDRREFRSARSAWRRFATGLGAAIATAGAVLVLLTFLMMAINPGDGLASTVALVVTGLLLAAIAGWAWMYFDRFGAWGVVATPEAIAVPEPTRYESTPAQAVAMTATSDAGDAADDADTPADDADVETEEVADEEDDALDEDDAEFAARSSKFELHHPERDAAEAPEKVEPDVDVGEDTDRLDAEASKFESHHPEGEAHVDGGETAAEPVEEAGTVGVDTAASAEEIETYVETLSVDEVSEDIVDEADVEPVGDEDAAPIESYEDLVAHGEATDADAVDDDPLEVLPEAHAAMEPLLEDASGQEPHGNDESDAGGREDALRRLRERQAERARQRQTDDA